ncbi:SDR family oxidoreductase [Kitasatospora sp. NPDC059673]|uniref:SDR family oxidoreductase n=1 Tax=Kitasatospora sp. NPDC059673 TaxID=3346901 RepID=UPI0036B974BC
MVWSPGGSDGEGARAVLRVAATASRDALMAQRAMVAYRAQREARTGFAGPETVAGVIAMLASDDGAFVTGTEIRIDGGTHA